MISASTVQLTGHARRPDGWIAAAQAHPAARMRLFCLPYAGGGASVFRAWSRSLPPEMVVCPIRLPGRESRLREAPYTSMAPLVEGLAYAIEPYLDLPFAIFGHSMGAWIGFEMAHRLAEHHMAPFQLVVSAMRAPQLGARDAPAHRLPDPEFVTRLREFQGTPAEALASPELLALMLPLLRADFELIETYRFSPRPPLACPTLALGGLSNHGVPREDLLAWRELTRGAFKLHMLPGNHFFIRDSHAAVPHLLADTLEVRCR